MDGVGGKGDRIDGLLGEVNIITIAGRCTVAVCDYMYSTLCVYVRRMHKSAALIFLDPTPTAPTPTPTPSRTIFSTGTGRRLLLQMR